MANKRSNLSEKAYKNLKSQITTHQIPPGNKIVEEEIARNLGVKGAYIRQLTLRDIEEIYEIRKVLEGLSIQQAKDKISSDDLSRIEQSLKDCDNAKTIKEKYQKFILSDVILHN
ncbi:MAG: hypothetical protein COY53_02690 [Elusimicrobia bacterium CG_4_10_14_0_8_um_filter_37_32]|nr:MAG: hypothetical protein COS17_08225 [Elusimicrobia bacterium CG02_land_8_20_14_3_00_37_13]PIZ13860.1 MAG: hypothetical protein COY53_02690 [Elusimicrobia bacterium CG_4_10_14_0_8_um_filter_37_32]